MKTYVYEEVMIGGAFVSGGVEHRELIDRYAKQGYRYVGWIPTYIYNDGRIQKIDLIFEKDSADK